MSITPKLVFFNKEGYPYNFTLNDGIWTGKIFFDPNSTDTFKTLSLYTLENVDPIEVESNFNIISSELFNESGITFSDGSYIEELVTNIHEVNESPSFYTKWIYGDNFHIKFPVGTVVSFSGNANPLATNGEEDFAENKGYFTVLRTIKNAIMISTKTNNYSFSFVFNSSINNFYLTSHKCITLLDPTQTVKHSFDIDDRFSVINTNYNDGVYELSKSGYTLTNIYDYNLSGLSYGDIISVDLTLLTERPILYNGDISLYYDGVDLYFTFVDGLSSNIEIGTNFICEDENWNHLLSSNEYQVESFVTEKEIITEDVLFITETYEQDDGKIGNNYIVRLNDNYDIQIGWKIRFDYILPFSAVDDDKNNRLIKNVIDIKSIDISGITYYDIYLDGEIYEIPYEINYKLTRILKRGEINTVVVIPSINNSVYTGYAKVMSTSNVINYNQTLPLTGSTISDDIINSIDIFINKFKKPFNSNGVDIYRKDSSIIFEGMYGGQKSYFEIQLSVNNVPMNIDENYSINASGLTYLYHMILNNVDITYERLNMSNNYNQVYYSDIIFNLFDDAQDFGFEIIINGIQYYISFNDISGTTSKTYETILSFIDKYEDALNKNGINISSYRTLVGTNYEEHIVFEGQKANVDIWEFNIKVNKNSSYEISSNIENNFMMLSSNKIESLSIDFINYGFSTGMIVSVSGSTYPLNNKEYNIIGLGSNYIDLSYQGPISTENNITLILKTRDFLRKPRETNDYDVYYRYRWEDDEDTSMFLYDLSGENLIPWGNNPLYRYIGPKPLSVNGDLVFLNKEPNKNIEQVSIPYKQQTVFDELKFKLQRFDDINASILPNPIQTFIGYNSKIENVNQRNLIIERVDDISYIGDTSLSNLYFEFKDNTIYMFSGTTSFLELGFKTDRYIRIKFVDKKPYSQSLFENYEDFYVTEVTNTTIKVREKLLYFSTENENFIFEFIQLPQRIGYLRIYGETESEDERFEANLKLLGVSLTEEDEFIFKQSDIREDGIDYRLLNRKRKEMFNVYPDIFNYVGSYRAILNSINFFGYDDVQLTEYYRNINTKSPYFNKLKRVVIPDLLERQVEGWTYSETIPNKIDYVKTSLLNLTYRITDEEGNNVLLYSLKDVQIKLNGLKKWLRRNVIPINSNIRDITGVSEVVGINWRRFDPGTNFTKNVISQENEAVNINYTATKNFNDQWLVSLRFYTISGISPEYWSLKVVTFKKDLETGELYPQESWSDLRTDLSNFNFSIIWDSNVLDENDYDRFFYVETTTYNDYGLSKTVNKMYRLEDGQRFYFDEFKNYTLVNNNFKYKTFPYVQNHDFVYIIDGNGNFWVIDKEIQLNR